MALSRGMALFSMALSRGMALFSMALSRGMFTIGWTQRKINIWVRDKVGVKVEDYLL